MAATFPHSQCVVGEVRLPGPRVPVKFPIGVPEALLIQVPLEGLLSPVKLPLKGAPIRVPSLVPGEECRGDFNQWSLP